NNATNPFSGTGLVNGILPFAIVSNTAGGSGGVNTVGFAGTSASVAGSIQLNASNTTTTFTSGNTTNTNLILTTSGNTSTIAAATTYNSIIIYSTVGASALDLQNTANALTLTSGALLIAGPQGFTINPAGTGNTGLIGFASTTASNEGILFI